MENKKQILPEETSGLESFYFEFQAEIGFTKHMGGLKATKELIELCHIDKGKYVLEVGCGVGKTSEVSGLAPVMRDRYSANSGGGAFIQVHSLSPTYPPGFVTRTYSLAALFLSFGSRLRCW